MHALHGLTTELGISIADGQVWLAIGAAFVLFVVCTCFGVAVARSIGLLDPHAPAAETLGVGLASGLLVLAAWWAALESGGRSSFTPVAFGFAIAVVLALSRGVLARRLRHGTEAPLVGSSDAGLAAHRRRPLLLATAGGAIFIAVVGLAYGSTLAPSPRDGVQPVEFMDEAFYSILASDLANTGTESLLSPSGFVDIPGTAQQNWYHWGEIWLASAMVKIFGLTPILARHQVVLPILLLAAATLTGTLVRRVNGTRSRGAFALGFVVCLFLAPIPLIDGPFFSSWAVGMMFGITLYGLAAVAILLAFFVLATPQAGRDTWRFAAFTGSAIALILPAHIVIAALASAGGATIFAIRLLRVRIGKSQEPVISSVWRRTILWATVGIVATTAWGLLSGHGVPASALSPGVPAFNTTWAATLVTIGLGAGVFYAMAVAWILVRRQSPAQADMYIAAAVVVVVGAIAWGARLGDFNMFHVFFGAIAVVATPVAAVAMWSVWTRVRLEKGRVLPVALALLLVIQLEFGLVLGVVRLQLFGPHEYEPVPLTLLAAIRQLPPDAAVAYACAPTEEVSYWDARLLSISAHTGRRVVPMCFEADVFKTMVGGERTLDASPLFRTAPQRTLYPDAFATPTGDQVSAFLRSHGVAYIYADARHPNDLVPTAAEVATVGEFRLLKIP